MLTFRHATLADLDKLVAVNAVAFADNVKYDDDIISDFMDTPEGVESVKTDIEYEGGCCIVAEEDGEIVGYVSGGPKEVPYCKSNYFEIINIGVIPEKRSAGVGAQLLDEVASWAKKHGYQKLYVVSFIKNERAIEFYQKNGYTPIDMCFQKTIE